MQNVRNASKAGSKLKLKHYLLEANPYRTVDSLGDLIATHLRLLPKHKELAILNKPPGFNLIDLSKDNGLIPALMDTVKSKFGWEKCLRFPMMTADQAGICLLAGNKATFELALKTMNVMFSSGNVAYLKFYGITSIVPIKSSNKEIFNVGFETIDNRLTYFEEKNASHNAEKRGNVTTFQIEHRVVDTNDSLNVALVEFQTTKHYGNGIPLYCVKNLCPLIGDHQFSSRVKSIFGEPVLSADPKNQKPEPQILNERVQLELGINKYMCEQVPLHLQLCEVNLEKKFKKQTLAFKHSVPLLPYFAKTLELLGLKMPTEQPPTTPNKTIVEKE